MRDACSRHRGGWLRSLVACAGIAALGPACQEPAAAPVVVGVSWSNFQEERWKTDEAAMRAELAQRGARYVSADAQSSTEKQLADVETLIARGANVLIIVAQDADAILPAVAAARAEGIPIIGYDRLIEAEGVFYLSFDNQEVGRMQARAIFERVPRGRYVFIKGGQTDPNADFVHAGQLEVLRGAIADGRIQIVGDQYVDGWLPENAQRVTEQILTANDNDVDAIVCSNDGMAGGVYAALAAQGLGGLPLSGQDGDHAALNRVARGQQTVSVWKDATALGRAAARIALELASGVDAIADAAPWTKGKRGTPVQSILLAPLPVTRDNLHVVLEAGWLSRDALCRGVEAATAPAACQAP